MVLEGNFATAILFIGCQVNYTNKDKFCGFFLGNIFRNGYVIKDSILYVVFN